VMTVGLADDVRYALASNEPEDIGDLVHWVPDPAMKNHFVRATGALASSGAIRYDRPMERDSFRLAPVSGKGEVRVEMRVPAGAEEGSFAPPTVFVGRLLPLRSAFRYRGLERSVREITGAVVPPNAWVLVDGTTPAALRWTVALAALLVAFAAYNLVTFARMLRRVRS
jgi:hypothetical protein